MKAIFLDRDGVINKDLGYVYKKEDFIFCDGIFEILRYFHNLGFELFIITNQSGIGRKYFTQSDFSKISEYMTTQLRVENINIKEIAHCPHTPDQDCKCRKPKPKMVNDLVNKFNININTSWFIGDKDLDMACAKNAKIKNKIQIISEYKNQTKLADFYINTLNKLKEIIK